MTTLADLRRDYASRALTEAEVKVLNGLKSGARELHP